jgi:hypothetical protein
VTENGFDAELPSSLYSVACSERYLFATDSEGTAVYAFALDGTGALVHTLRSAACVAVNGEGPASLFVSLNTVSSVVWRSFLVVALYKESALQAVDVRAESPADWKVTPHFGSGAGTGDRKAAGAAGAEAFAGRFANIEDMCVVGDRLLVLDNGEGSGRVICFDGELRADELRLHAVWTALDHAKAQSMAVVPVALRPAGAVVLSEWIGRGDSRIVEIGAADGKVVRSFAVAADVSGVLFDGSRLLVETTVRMEQYVAEWDFVNGVRVRGTRRVEEMYLWFNRSMLAMDGMLVVRDTSRLYVESIPFHPA